MCSDYPAAISYLDNKKIRDSWTIKVSCIIAIIVTREKVRVIEDILFYICVQVPLLWTWYQAYLSLLHRGVPSKTTEPRVRTNNGAFSYWLSHLVVK